VGWCVAAWVAATIAQLPTATLFIAAAHSLDSEGVYLWMMRRCAGKPHHLHMVAIPCERFAQALGEINRRPVAQYIFRTADITIGMANITNAARCKDRLDRLTGDRVQQCQQLTQASLTAGANVEDAADRRIHEA